MFSFNKWSTLNLIIIPATKSMVSLQVERNRCVLQLEPLTFSGACLGFSTEINGIKGHSVQLLEWHSFPRQRQIPSPLKQTNYCTECQKLELPQFQFKTD